MRDSSLSILNTTNGKLPRLPFARIKESILGKTYELSLVVISPKKSKALNMKHRGKDYSANVLSFPLSKKSGELFLDPETAKKQAPEHELSVSKFLLLLVIHGMLHLKGYDHGSTMEREEKKFLKKFS